MSTAEFVDYASNYAPWRKGVAWWVVLIQAIIALAIGIYALIDGESAAWIIIAGFCVYFIIAALRTIWQALRGKDIGFSVLGLLSAGGGLAVGTAILVPVLRNFFTGDNVLDLTATTLIYVFGVAMLVIGVLSTGSAFVERPEQGVRWASVIRGVVFIVLGIYILVALNNLETAADSAVIVVLSWAFVVIGALLALQAFLLYRSSRPQPSPARASTVPAATTSPTSSTSTTPTTPTTPPSV